MRILVFMSDNRKLENKIGPAEYNSLAASINYEYCKKYNYDFIYYRPYLKDKDIIKLENCIDPNTKKLRHSAWSKLLSTSLALKLNYDYVVYIDSDCIFKDFHQSLEDFIMPHMKKDIIFLNNKPWGNDKPCSGFYVCKVCENTRQMVSSWYDFDFKEKRNPCRFEQGALWCTYKDSIYDIGIVDSWMFREEAGQFLRHVGTHEKQQRMPYFSSFIKENNIDYVANINNITVIEFNTDAK